MINESLIKAESRNRTSKQKSSFIVEWFKAFLVSALILVWFVLGLFFGTYYAFTIHLLLGLFVLAINVAFGVSIFATMLNRALGLI